MTKDKLLNDIFKWGVLSAVVTLALPELAWAAGSAGIGSSLSQFTSKDANQVVPLISVASYTIGAFLGVSGALKLKKHAENPAQEKLAPGIAALLAGGGLVALPSLLGTLTATTYVEGDATYGGLSIN